MSNFWQPCTERSERIWAIERSALYIVFLAYSLFSLEEIVIAQGNVRLGPMGQPFYVKMFEYKKGGSPVTEHASERTIALPFYNNLREEQIDYVVNELKSEIESVKRL